MRSGFTQEAADDDSELLYVAPRTSSLQRYPLARLWIVGAAGKSIECNKTDNEEELVGVRACGRSTSQSRGNARRGAGRAVPNAKLSDREGSKAGLTGYIIVVGPSFNFGLTPASTSPSRSCTAAA